MSSSVPTIIAEFIALGIFASAGVGGILIFRRMIRMISMRAKLESLKTEKQIVIAEHEIEVIEHKHVNEIRAIAAEAAEYTGGQEIVSIHGSDKPRESRFARKN